MPPRRVEEQPFKAAEEVAKLLSTLLQDPEVSQQLQQPPAALPTQQQQVVTLTAKGTLLLVQLNQLLRGQLQAPSPSVPAATTGTGTAALKPGRLLGCVLRHKAACAVGTMLAWTLQRPEQLELKEMLINARTAIEGPYVCVPAAADLWDTSCKCLTLMGLSVVEEQMVRQASCRAETLAAAMLQQLDQSGK
jgi:hypothetical protein